jgi:hypothetical protein
MHDHILLSHLRLPQPAEPSPRIYTPQEQDSSVTSPGTEFPFRRLLRLVRLRWRYSNPPPLGHDDNYKLTTSPHYTTPTRTKQRTFHPLLLALSLPRKQPVHRGVLWHCSAVACLHSCYLTMGVLVTIYDYLPLAGHMASHAPQRTIRS